MSLSISFYYSLWLAASLAPSLSHRPAPGKAIPPRRLSIDRGKADPKGFFANSVLQLQENPI